MERLKAFWGRWGWRGGYLKTYRLARVSREEEHFTVSGDDIEVCLHSPQVKRKGFVAWGMMRITEKK